MDTAIVIWLIIFTAAALLFFGTAVVISVVGSKDLKSLLSKSATRAEEQ